jgi:two-component system, NarL family, invasion response regulator UvrY
MNRPQLRVLITDDHATLRYGIKRLVEEIPGVAATAEAGSGAEMLEIMRSGRWDVLLLDLEMPGSDSLDLLRHVKTRYPATAVLIFSMYPEQQFALRAIRGGAAGYLNKQASPEQLQMAVRRVGEGGTYISAALALELAGTVNVKGPQADETLLSDREFTVMRGIAAGKPIAEIGRELNLSAKTVSTYRARVLTKLHLQSNVELARYAVERGLVK